MKIFYIGKFRKLHDEEYIARSFEILGHEVVRFEDENGYRAIQEVAKEKPDIVLFAKLNIPNPDLLIKYCRQNLIKTVCWVFDLYWGYSREHQITKNPMFQADYVATTDGGNQKKWEALLINHKCIRQGIYEPHCFIVDGPKYYDVIFVGSENPLFPQRAKVMKAIAGKYNFRWFGKDNTDEVRNEDLNKLFSQAKIVVGDSYPSPNYWSNRVVETLGRGGFLLHLETEGLKEEYPDLVTFKAGELFDKIDYYLEHEDERKEIIQKNFSLVKSKYTCKDKCEELLKWVNQ